MQVSKFWQKEVGSAVDKNGHPYLLTAWGASASSDADAKQDALAKLERWVAKLARGEDIGEYEYLNSAIREELVEEITDFSGNLIGAITRNRYGALVLNATDVFIADVDTPTPGFGARLLAMLGRRLRDKTYHIEKIKAYVQENPGVNAVIYETHSGLRVFLTERARDPGDAQSMQLLETLGSDHLYKALCRTQKCYRARLTPKPWRCSAARPPNHFPREELPAQIAFDKWLTEYDAAAKAYAVCRHVATVGSGTVSPNARKILEAHDGTTLNSGAGSLA
jgi:hypothetical protein